MSISRNFQIAQLLDKDRGIVKASKIDSDLIVTSSLLGTEAASAGTDIYTNLNDLPADATTGTQAYVSSNNGLYVKYSNGWYRVALINNSPYWVTQPDGTYSLNIDGTATTITVNAGDSDGHSITFTATGDSDFNLIATVTKDSDNGRIFTVIPIDSENSASPTAGSGVLTFKASDGISFASQDSTFSITFSTVVANSAETVLLVKALGAADNNDDISYQNGSDKQLDTVGFTNSGNPQATFFSPYRRGGYSTYFDGTGDYLTSSSVYSGVGSSADFTAEAWIWIDPNISDTNPLILCSDNNGFNFGVKNSSGFKINVGHSYVGDLIVGSTTISTGTWTHIAAVRNSGTLKAYVNGVEDASVSDTSNFAGTTNYIASIPALTNYDFHGYVRDARFVSGTAVYTSAFTPPTEPLTAISGTTLLACHLPYFADGSTNGYTLTPSGNSHTVPFGPYDYNPHITLSQSGYDSDIGSTYFDGNSYVYASALGSEYTFGSGDFTVEAWYFPKTLSSGADAVVTTADTNDRQGIWMGVNNDKMYVLTGQGTTWLSAQSTASLVLNQWNHMAAVRNGNTVYGYLNGTQVLSYSESRTLTNSNNAIRIGGRSVASQRSNGYISDVRVIKGTAQYTSAFTPPSSRLQWVTNTVLQMQNILDPRIFDTSSSIDIDVVGGTVTNTSVRKFTTSSSIYFPGPSSGTDGIRIISPVGFPMSKEPFLTADFTIEFWIYPTGWFTNDIFMCYDAGGGNTGSWNLYNSSGIKFYADNDADATWDLVSAASAFSTWTNSWKHFAMTYDASAQTLKIYLDGTQEYSVGSITGWESGGSLGTYNTLAINQGATDTNKGAFTGYIQDVRVSKSVRYTTAFTPPTAEFEL